MFPKNCDNFTKHFENVPKEFEDMPKILCNFLNWAHEILEIYAKICKCANFKMCIKNALNLPKILILCQKYITKLKIFKYVKKYKIWTNF
jgi:hypothetical protein